VLKRVDYGEKEIFSKQKWAKGFTWNKEGLNA
jgi:hypothetical protein